MKYKFAFVMAALSFFAIKANSSPSTCYLNEFKTDPKVTLTWKKKCEAHSVTYICKGGFKPDAILINQWTKDTQADSLYEFSNVVGDSTSHFAFIEETIYPLLEKSCVTGCFANGDMSSGHKDISTCPKKSDEQSLKFQIVWPDDNSSRVTWITCNGEGGTALLNQVYPKAKWIQVAKLPHYYLYKAMSSAEADNLLDLIHKLRESTKGCHYGP